jgi:hypothetical protein
MGVASESSGAAGFCWRRSSSWRETETKDGWSLSFGTRKSLVVFESGLVYVKAADRIGQSFILTKEGEMKQTLSRYNLMITYLSARVMENIKKVKAFVVVIG